MKIENDAIKIGFGAREADGTKVEPEAQPVVRTALTTGELRGRGDAKAVGALPVVLEQRSTALDFALQLKRSCQNCIWYDDAAFRMWVQRGLAIDSSAQQKADVEAVLRLLEDRNVLPSRLSLAGVGVCKAISSIENAVYVVGALESCPTRYAELFKPTSDGAKDGEKAADAVLFKASGKL